VSASESAVAGPRRSRAVLWILPVGVVGCCVWIAAVALVAVLVVFELSTGTRDEPMLFSTDLWRSETGMQGTATGPSPSVRGRMLQDLLTQHLVAGTEREDVRALLGPPTVIDEPARDWRYAVCWEEAWLGFGRRATWLILEFDGSGRLSTAWSLSMPE
jgi:hypothetical protein